MSDEPKPVVLHHREHGLRLAEGDLRCVAVHRDHAECSFSVSLPMIAFSSCSKPPCSIEQCMPHSFGAFDSHHQRPARSSSSGPIARVHGAPGEATRSGRWWWETNAPKECGIHCAIETGGFEHELHALLSEDHA